MKYHPILQELSPATLPMALDANLIAYSSLFGSLPQAQLYNDEGILWFETGIPDDLFNGVLQIHLKIETLPVMAERVLAHFQQRGLPFHWHLGPSSSPQNARDVLAARGIKHVEDEPGMAVDLLALNENLPLNPRLVIQPVTTHELLEQWIRVWGFAVPEEVIQHWLSAYSDLPYGPEGPLRLYLGSIDDVPVATTALFFAAGVASINWVVTLPQFRRQGIGASITLMAAHVARSAGYRIGVLTASPLGLNIYRKLGFKEYCRVSTYAWNPSNS